MSDEKNLQQNFQVNVPFSEHLSNQQIYEVLWATTKMGREGSMTKTPTDTTEDQRAGLEKSGRIAFFEWLGTSETIFDGRAAAISTFPRGYEAGYRDGLANLRSQLDEAKNQLAEAAMYIDIRDKQMNEDGYTIHRLRSEAVELKSQLNAANEKLNSIAYLVKDHAEPGYECVQCLIEGVLRGELNFAQQKQTDARKERLNQIGE